MYQHIAKYNPGPRYILASIAGGLCLLAGSWLISPSPPTHDSGPTSPIYVDQLPAGTPLVPITIATPNRATQIYSSSTELADTLQPATQEISTTEQSANLYKEYLADNEIVVGSTTYPLRDYSTSAVPNDPGSGQWWETAINAPAAWDVSTGDTSTVLAIIDTGFALQHEEFVGRWYTNQGETGPAVAESASLINCSDQAIAIDESCNLIDDNFDGIVDNESGATIYENDSQLNCSDQAIALDKSCNMIDDDGNGLADDITGWDYINYDRSVQAGETNPTGSGTRHGSYVAAVAAGNTNNSTGIAGVSWNTKILPIQAIDDDGYGNSISVARAVDYAVAQGADVISMSLGGAYPDSYLRLSLQNAIAQGVVIAAASGNDGCNCISYPANYPEIIAVGALDYSLERASFSSYGPNLDITAPGVGMYTATWTVGNGINGYASGIAGTSLATPLVGGALANLKSQQPTATPLQLTAALLEAADQSVLAANEPHSTAFGFGRLDLYAASQRLAQAFEPTTVYTFGGLTVDSTADVDKIYQCENGIKGSSGVYYLTKLGYPSTISASLTDVYNHQVMGYAAQRLAFGCVLQPHDNPQEFRSINTASEFLNTFLK